MFEKLKELFFGKPTEKPAVTPAPYKIETPDTNWPFPRASETAPENHVRVESVKPVEAPAPVSATYNVPEPAATTPIPLIAEQAPVKKGPAKKPAAKKTADKTPAVKKAPAKKKLT